MCRCLLGSNGPDRLECNMCWGTSAKSMSSTHFCSGNDSPTVTQALICSCCVVQADDVVFGEPTEAEIADYAVYLGIDPSKDPELLWIAKQVMLRIAPEASSLYFRFVTKGCAHHQCAAAANVGFGSAKQSFPWPCNGGRSARSPLPLPIGHHRHCARRMGTLPGRRGQRVLLQSIKKLLNLRAPYGRKVSRHGEESEFHCLWGCANSMSSQGSYLCCLMAR